MGGLRGAYDQYFVLKVTSVTLLFARLNGWLWF